ncbi:hypothetical protein C8R44DRAFT_886571 [Mycena epipterygia]|nr:hypothetical protein C8R44DRAFT_886571 [Mycena epipterygia]
MPLSGRGGRVPYTSAHLNTRRPAIRATLLRPRSYACNEDVPPTSVMHTRTMPVPARCIIGVNPTPPVDAAVPDAPPRQSCARPPSPSLTDSDFEVLNYSGRGRAVTFRPDSCAFVVRGRRASGGVRVTDTKRARASGARSRDASGGRRKMLDTPIRERLEPTRCEAGGYDERGYRKEEAGQRKTLAPLLLFPSLRSTLRPSRLLLPPHPIPTSGSSSPPSVSQDLPLLRSSPSIYALRLPSVLSRGILSEIHAAIRGEIAQPCSPPSGLRVILPHSFRSRDEFHHSDVPDAPPPHWRICGGYAGACGCMHGGMGRRRVRERAAVEVGTQAHRPARGELATGATGGCGGGGCRARAKGYRREVELRPVLVQSRTSPSPVGRRV